MKEQYLDSVRALLDCPQGEQERLLSRLGQAVSAYLEDAPEAGEPELAANFGTPEECAARLLEECDPGAVAAERRKKKKRHRLTVAVLAVLLAVMVGITAYLWSNGGFVVIRLGEYDPSDWENLPPNHVIYDYDNEYDSEYSTIGGVLLEAVKSYFSTLFCGDESDVPSGHGG